MSDWRVQATIIGSIFWLVLAVASGWREHQCETNHYERQRGNPPVFATPCISAQNPGEQTGDSSHTAPESDWFEVKTEHLTLVVLAATLLVLVLQVRIYRNMRDHTMVVERAYLSAEVGEAIYQDERLRFEAKAVLRNTGHTPAYGVTFRAAAKIIGTPISPDFDYPLPDSTAGKSVSFMPPGSSKIISRLIEERFPDAEAAEIRQGHKQALAMWGIANYRDAFQEERFLKFAFIFYWIERADKDGKSLPPQLMSIDTPSHNDAN